MQVPVFGFGRVEEVDPCPFLPCGTRRRPPLGWEGFGFGRTGAPSRDVFESGTLGSVRVP